MVDGNIGLKGHFREINLIETVASNDQADL